MDRKWRALIIVCVAIFMLLLDITVVNVALPSIQKELHASFTDLQWVVDAYALTLAASTLIGGSLGDLLGRKRVFTLGPKNCFTKYSMVPVKSQKVMSVSTARPSIWWNM